MNLSDGQKRGLEKLKALDRKSYSAILAETELAAKTALSNARIEFSKLVPRSYRNLWLKYFIEQKSRAAAIKLKCYDCMGFENARQRVDECDCETCPLPPFRPRSKK